MWYAFLSDCPIVSGLPTVYCSRWCPIVLTFTLSLWIRNWEPFPEFFPGRVSKPADKSRHIGIGTDFSHVFRIPLPVQKFLLIWPKCTFMSWGKNLLGYQLAKRDSILCRRRWLTIWRRLKISCLILNMDWELLIDKIVWQASLLSVSYQPQSVIISPSLISSW